MSVESAQAFIERLKVDDEFLERVKACKDAKERNALAAAEGFSFSANEMEQVKVQLTDDDMRRTFMGDSHLGYDGEAGHGG